MKQAKRKIENLNLLDDFLFYEVVSGEKGEGFCRLLLQTVCGKKVENIRICPQKIVQGADTGYHGIRMDLYVNDEGRCLYDIEPDKYTSRDALPRRNRYYRALLDGKLLDTGTDFAHLPDLWTVFILPHDPFGRDRMCYTVRNRILEEPDIEYRDGAVSLFLFTKGRQGGNKTLSQLLRYIEDSVEENATTKELKALHNYVTEIKHRKEVGVRYMKSWELEQMWRREARIEGLAEGRAEGRKKGCIEGRIQSVIELLEYKGQIPDDLRERIIHEKNPEFVRRWLKLAAMSESIEQFEEKM